MDKYDTRFTDYEYYNGSLTESVVDSSVCSFLLSSPLLLQPPHLQLERGGSFKTRVVLSIPDWVSPVECQPKEGVRVYSSSDGQHFRGDWFFLTIPVPTNFSVFSERPSQVTDPDQVVWVAVDRSMVDVFPSVNRPWTSKLPDLQDDRVPDLVSHPSV